ncbi:uroporphyrinogen decarboxylase family protein [Oceanobacillus oncorhynchi]|uniref:uroporphyrinogen decarboxylase family protein n=1 Tax=Oceanobacillus oncorhynchi TaxID=545501 RepID=UPI001865F8C9|nr:uroporphyrinogen decarboxylase family protein [Oceanobacillus oncorhynchi]
MREINEGKDGFSFWTHFPLDDLDSEKIVKQISTFNHDLEMNVIKTMPNGLFAIEDWISELVDYSDVAKGGVAKIHEITYEDLIEKMISKDLTVTSGAYKREIDSIIQLRDSLSPNTEMICTVFTPLTLLKKLFPRHLPLLMNSSVKEKMDQIAAKIMAVTKEYIEAACSSGCAGFFFANQAVDFHYQHPEIYQEYGLKMERELVDFIHQQHKYIILHLHGQIKSTDILKQFNVEGYSWHIDESDVTIDDFHKEMPIDKVIFGGLSRTLITEGKVDEVLSQVDTYLQGAYNRQIIFAPECVIRHPINMPVLTEITGYIKERMNQKSNANQIDSFPWVEQY